MGQQHRVSTLKRTTAKGELAVHSYMLRPRRLTSNTFQGQRPSLLVLKITARPCRFQAALNHTTARESASTREGLIISCLVVALELCRTSEQLLHLLLVQLQLQPPAPAPHLTPQQGFSNYLCRRKGLRPGGETPPTHPEMWSCVRGHDAILATPRHASGTPNLPQTLHPLHQGVSDAIKNVLHGGLTEQVGRVGALEPEPREVHLKFIALRSFGTAWYGLHFQAAPASYGSSHKISYRLPGDNGTQSPDDTGT